MFELTDFRKHFPSLYNQPGIYLDSAATTLTPQAVSASLEQYYCYDRATVGRSTYRRALQVTARVEEVRDALAQYLNAPPGSAIIFTSGTTLALNLAALAMPWRPGDNVVCSLLEHHSNLLPWMALKERGVELRLVRPNAAGQFQPSQVFAQVDEHTRLIALTQASNVLGVPPPLAEICAAAHQRHILVIVDGAQGLGHMPVDLQQLGCDGYAASAHKAYGPTGLGLLVLSPAAQEVMRPPILGGGMIAAVTAEQFSAQAAPHGWEAGTPPIASILAWGAALPLWQQAISPVALEHVEQLTGRLMEYLVRFPGVRLLGPADPAAHHGIVSFTVAQFSPHRVASMLDEGYGIMLRSGQHCAMPLHQEVLNAPLGSLRVSLAPYNTLAEIATLLTALQEIMKPL